MKDFPVFPTEYGVVSLILKEIPYKGIAYIRIQDHQKGMLAPLLEECVPFCRMVGAEKIFATGSDELADYPLDCVVYRMTGPAGNQEGIARLWPVLPENVGRWREIYNSRMAGVSNAATMTSKDEKRLCEASGTYFVHDGGDLLGIGWVEDGELLVVASVKPGEGERVVRTMLSLMDTDCAVLEVASTNTRAIRLYERLGFRIVGEISRWYQV